ncbi:MAG: hypothetical protein AAF555_04520 [Verrucomicrobiota bacterium]
MKQLSHLLSQFTLAAVSLFAFSSCVESITTVNVKKDGSGTIVEELYMGEGMKMMMAQMAMQFGGDAGDLPENPLLDQRGEFEGKAGIYGEGVEFTSFEESRTEDGRVGIKAVYSFADITTVVISPAGAMDAANPMGGGQEEVEEDPVTFAFEKGDVPKLTVLLPQPEPGAADLPEEMGEAEMPAEEELAQAKQLLGDMAVRIFLAVEGEISETNASHVEGNRISLLEMEMGKLLDNPEALQKMQRLSEGDQPDMAKIQETFAEMEGMKMETESAVEVSFQ